MENEKLCLGNDKESDEVSKDAILRALALRRISVLSISDASQGSSLIAPPLEF
jgi:hypothetical protein